MSNLWHTKKGECARIIKISKYYQTFNRCFFSQVTTVTELSVTSDTGQCRPGQARSGQAGRAEQQPSLALLCSLFLGTELWLPGSSVLVSYGRTIRPRGSWFNPGHGIVSVLQNPVGRILSLWIVICGPVDKEWTCGLITSTACQL